MTAPATLFGSEAESVAARWLESQGFRILDRNWRRPWGELDIVAHRSGTVRFIEVKASARLRPGFEPILRADPRKMARVARTARTWLAASGYPPDTPWQMDVLSVIMDRTGPAFEHIENV